MCILKTGYGGSGKVQRGLRTSHRYRMFHESPIISHVLIFVQRAFLWAYFSGGSFSEGITIGGNFAFQNVLDLTINTA